MAICAIADWFWKRWVKEYLPLLQHREKWLKPSRNLRVGDVVLMRETNTKRGDWPKALVTDTFADRDNIYEGFECGLPILRSCVM